MSDRVNKREVFFEFTRLDANLRVCAVDAVTGFEIVTLLPAKMPEHEAQNIALKKLIWRLGKEGITSEEGDQGPSRPAGKYV